ncbi:hypothetical protein A2U01_0085378, partial [Trifolium medium]|nr:hypothetical protein [Trifolium medium]
MVETSLASEDIHSEHINSVPENNPDTTMTLNQEAETSNPSPHILTETEIINETQFRISPTQALIPPPESS